MNNIAIIGAGASGLCAAIQLGKLGIPYTIFEKNAEVGGTWYENRYPGCAVDTPNHFYQFSFEPNNNWPNNFSHAYSRWHIWRQKVQPAGPYPGPAHHRVVEERPQQHLEELGAQQQGGRVRAQLSQWSLHEEGV